ncbi:ATP-binding protein, partial [Mammaliicoccus sciuri]
CYIALQLYRSQQTDVLGKRTKIISILEGTNINTDNYNSQYGNMKPQDEDKFIKELQDVLHLDSDTPDITKILEKASYNVSSFENLLDGLNYVFLLEESKGNNQARAYSATLETRIKNVQSRFSRLFSHEDTELEHKTVVYSVA